MRTHRLPPRRNSYERETRSHLFRCATLLQSFAASLVFFLWQLAHRIWHFPISDSILSHANESLSILLISEYFSGWKMWSKSRTLISVSPQSTHGWLRRWSITFDRFLFLCLFFITFILSLRKGSDLLLFLVYSVVHFLHQDCGFLLTVIPKSENGLFSLHFEHVFIIRGSGCYGKIRTSIRRGNSSLAYQLAYIAIKWSRVYESNPPPCRCKRLALPMSWPGIKIFR